MTVSSIEVAKALVDEMESNNEQVGSVWVYENSINHSQLFAVFTIQQWCDIHESPYVDKPVRIWRNGRWIGDYGHLNEIE